MGLLEEGLDSATNPRELLVMVPGWQRKGYLQKVISLNPASRKHPFSSLQISWNIQEKLFKSLWRNYSKRGDIIKTFFFSKADHSDQYEILVKRFETLWKKLTAPYEAKLKRPQ